MLGPYKAMPCIPKLTVQLSYSLQTTCSLYCLFAPVIEGENISFVNKVD